MMPYISMISRCKHYLFFILYNIIIFDFKILFFKKIKLLISVIQYTVKSTEIKMQRTDKYNIYKNSLINNFLRY